jgi:hypothetical protein
MLQYVLMVFIALTIIGMSLSSYFVGSIQTEDKIVCPEDHSNVTSRYLASSIGLTSTMIIGLTSIILLVIVMSPDVLR